MELSVLRYHTLCFIIFLFTGVWALYEEDIGKFDWHIRSIGPMKFSFFDQTHHTNRRVIISSELSVLASVTLRSGDLVWRRSLEEYRPIDTVLYRESTLITVSDNGKVVRRWDPESGHLQWEMSSEGEYETNESYINAYLNETNKIILLTSTKLKYYSVGGHLLIHKDLNMEMDGAVAFKMSVLKSSIILLLYNSNSKSVNWVSMLNSKVQENGIIQAFDNFREEHCLLVGMRSIVCLDKQTAKFYVATLEQSEFIVYTLIDLHIGPIDLTEESCIQISDHFSKVTPRFYFILSANRQFILELEFSDNSIRIVQSFSSDNSLLLFDDILENNIIVFSLTSDFTNLSVRCYDLYNEAYIDSLEITLAMNRFSGSPVRAVPYLFYKKGQSIGYRIIVSFQDGSFSLIQQTGRISWTRDEALSDIVSAKFITLSTTEENTIYSSVLLDSATSTNPVEGFYRMIYSQAIYVRDRILHIKQIILEPSIYNETLHEAIQPVQSAAIFVTRLGKVYCIDSKSGLFLWNLYLPHLTGYLSSIYEDTCIIKLINTSPESALVILGHSNSPDYCNGTVSIVVNPLTGEYMPNYPSCLSYNISQSVQLEEDGKVVAIALLDSDNTIHIFPDTYSLQPDTRLFMYTADAQTGEITGHHFSTNGDDTFKHVPTWSFILPRLREELVLFSVKNSAESIYANARVLSDRSVLYKYLNPHLTVLITESRNERKPCVYLYVLDGVSGRLIHQLYHSNARSTVPPILAENWIAYQIINLKEKRQEFIMLEMYEGKTVNNASTWTSFANINVLVLSRSFILPGDLYTMTVTSTNRGITPKDIILGFGNGQLFSLPKSFVEPKIPHELSKSPSPEPAKSPTPKIPLSYQRVINYNKSIDRLREILVAPAELESTCSVLAYGIDIFHTQSSPSKSFDKLAEDFGYTLIIGVLAVFLVFSLVGSSISVYRKTNQNWC
ncbi:ER membrane protein complex subunit 1 [Oopsacas minuta]|uniref:ER membrane protein complex subunit 1 n=1 Tax=Oopsacas minuta TaxID=111878 RepID=A0AAV7JT59_9METZ|nr:ER membrane protein complex subunit 1 [Oopsacas minuta]